MQATETQDLNALLVGGSNRGLGLGLAKAMLSRGWTVTATSRHGADDRDLQTLMVDHPRSLVLEELDLGTAPDVDTLPAKLSGRPLDVVVLNGATSGPEHRSVVEVTVDECGDLFFVNALGPIRLAHLLVDHMVPDGVFAFVSSVQGSVERNVTGANPLYRASKAALNSLTRSFFMSTGKRFTVLSLHPGWVKTSMGGVGATVEIDDSATGLLDVISHHRGESTHQYLDYQGATIPW